MAGFRDEVAALVSELLEVVTEKPKTIDAGPRLSRLATGDTRC